MKYLDERIVLKPNVGYPYPQAGIYRYAIYNSMNYLVFNGNYYYNGSGSNVEFDVTDIVRSLNIKDDTYLTVPYTVSSIEGYAVNSFKVVAWTNSSIVSSATWTDVAMVYRYPNSKGYYTDGSETYWFTSATTHSIQALLQGSNYYGTCKYLPHYPLKRTDNYFLNQRFLHTNDINEIMLKTYQSQSYNEYYTLSVSQGDERSTLTHITLNDLIPNSQGLVYNKDLTIYYDTYGLRFEPMATIDSCPSRYYLMWQDRFGGYQSQGFGNHASFSETFNVTETENYIGERKKSYIQVQPKWKISSGWITEEWYFIYESIFVSPMLVLYDTYEDKSYNVIMNDNYTEKTYRDEKKMLNLTLELEEISKQNIIY